MMDGTGLEKPLEYFIAVDQTTSNRPAMTKAIQAMRKSPPFCVSKFIRKSTDNCGAEMELPCGRNFAQQTCFR